MSASGRRHAVVFGASIAGLLTARVLSEHFQQVTLLDKDSLPQKPVHRRYVPQSHHIHALLPNGREAMSELFPGFEEEMIARGAARGDPGRRAIMIVGGKRHCERDTNVRGLLASRLLVEDVLRSRVRTLANVHVLDATETVGFLNEGSAVTGLRLRSAEGERDLAADLVIDCSGRGSRTPAWIKALGFDPPEEEELRIDMRYRTRHFRLPPGEEPFILVIAATPQCPRGGVMAYQENGLYLCTIGGYNGDACADDLDSYLAFAKTLPSPALYEWLSKSEAVDEMKSYGMPSNLRRRYEKLRAFPAGLLVLGDAMCSFDPIYGQGMSVSALEARRLRDWLARPGASALQWFRMAAQIIDSPWAIATGGDAYVMGLPQARKGLAGLINRYLERLHARATTDPIVADAFMRVSGLYEPPPALLRPGVAWRVLRGPRAPAAA